MAASRRIDLTTLSGDGAEPPSSRLRHVPDTSASTAPSGSPKSERASSVRLELDLSGSTDRRCPEFCYPDVVSQKSKGSPNTGSGEDGLGTLAGGLEERETDELRALAKRFEERHGGVPNQRRDRLEDLVDIGYGYDDSDSFIDNSEAYDELVPACLTTKLGGFYINIGTLQFRRASDGDRESETDDFEETIEPKKRKIKKVEDGSEVKTNKKKKRKKEKPKENEKISGPPAEKKKKKANKEPSIDSMLKKFHKEKLRQLEMFNLKGNEEEPEVANGATFNSQVQDAEEPVLADPPLTLVSSASAGELLQAVNTVDHGFDLDGLLNEGQGSPVLKKNQEALVVCRAVKSPCSLPEGLPPALELSIQELAQALGEVEDGNIMETFAPEINDILLNVSVKSKELSNEVCSRTFSYLASQLSCKKASLYNRAKELHLLQLDDRVRDVLQKLKALVTSAMPEQIDHFNSSWQEFSKARAARLEAEREPRPVGGSDEDEEDKGGKRGPRKRFRWTAEIRELLSEAVKLKMSGFELEAPCSQTLEDHLKAFTEADVKTLWPKGWMQSRILLIESRKVHCHITGVTARKKSTVPKSKKAQETKTKLPSVRAIQETPEQERGGVERSACVSAEGTSLVVKVPAASSARPSLACGKHDDKRSPNVSPAKGECATVQGGAATDASCGVPDLPTPSLSLQASSFYSRSQQTGAHGRATPRHAAPYPEEGYDRDPSEDTHTGKTSTRTNEAPVTLLCGLTRDGDELHAEGPRLQRKLH